MKAQILPARFLDKIAFEPKRECWLWRGAIVGGGYGQFCVGADAVRRGEPRLTYAHRFSYEAKFGPIPNGLEIDHLCRVRNCVNPEHLEAVTSHENIRRGESGKYNREKTHCPKGHPYSGDNLYRRPNGDRHCRICKRSALREYKERRRARERGHD